MTATEAPPATVEGVCTACSWKYGAGPAMSEPPLELGRCTLCRGAAPVMPPTMAELDAAARAWLGEG
jgi:hypothetical protein